MKFITRHPFVNKYLLPLALLCSVVLLMIVFFISRSLQSVSFTHTKNAPRVITDNITVPVALSITGREGRMVESTQGQPVPLAPQEGSQTVIVTDAVLTVKGAYALALKETAKDAPDAKPVFVRSLGTVTLDGHSSYWQVGFGSAKNKKGYEALIQGEKIVSLKEIPSQSYGYALPKNWYDSGDAIDSIRTMPQFTDATVSSISFFYNEDGKRWGYALGTSKGTVSVPVR